MLSWHIWHKISLYLSYSLRKSLATLTVTVTNKSPSLRREAGNGDSRYNRYDRRWMATAEVHPSGKYKKEVSFDKISRSIERRLNFVNRTSSF